MSVMLTEERLPVVNLSQYEIVAQMVEQAAVNRLAAGSSPAGSANIGLFVYRSGYCPVTAKRRVRFPHRPPYAPCSRWF